MNSSQLSGEVKNMIAEDRLPSVVCFDYFDTLITRTVFPESTKQLAAKQLASLLGKSLSWRTLYELRSGFEKSLCCKTEGKGDDLEFSLDKLAVRMYTAVNNIHDFPRWVSLEQFIGIFSAIELRIEKSVQIPCPVMFDLVRYLHAENVSICLISDFYFSKQPNCNSQR